ncbi:MAG: SpoIIIAH-like family protein [Oscillospiraceae bacterium]|nr:SpoIIIAH-like family protein [Oscillospiraceae bacterium]
MKTVWKKSAVIASVLLLVVAAIYLNWRYSGQVEESSKVLGESTLVNAGESGVKPDETASPAPEEPPVQEDDYFATARLSRKQARDSAINMLQTAEVDEYADEATLNEASRTLQVLAAYTVAESQIESLVTAKGYQDCVAFMGEESISVVVSAAQPLTSADVARIKDIVISETDYSPEQIKILEAN